MIIENLDAFKSWLIQTLVPICDADPNALARYVVALVKKDKTEDELRGLCMAQLDVFLVEKTKQFVDILFECLRHNSYLAASGVKTEVKLNANTSTSSGTTKPDITVATAVTGGSNSSSRRLTAQNSGSGKEETKKPKPEQKEKDDSRSKRTRSHSPNKDRDDRRDDRRRHGYDRRRSPVGRTRSRYSRYDPDSRRSRYSPPKRNLSPRRSRSRSRERARPPRSNSRSLSRSLSRSKSRSKSPAIGGRRRSGSLDSRSSTPLSDRGDKDYRDFRIPPPGHVDTRPSRPRCRDYDEKGFCMRGDLCPFDHGCDPVIVDDMSLPSVLPFPPPTGPPPAGPHMMGPMPPGPPPRIPPPQGPGMIPPHGQGMPPPGPGLPPPGPGLPPRPGQGMPPQQGQGMPPPQGQGMPPHQGQGMPPQQGQGMPPQPGMPPQQGQGMPPQPGMPPQLGAQTVPPGPGMPPQLPGPMPPCDRPPMMGQPPLLHRSQGPPRMPLAPPAQQPSARLPDPPLPNSRPPHRPSFSPSTNENPPPPPGTMPVAVPHSAGPPCFRPPGGPQNMEPYNPEAPAIRPHWGSPQRGGHQRGGHHQGGYHPAPPRQRDLVSVPTEPEPSIQAKEDNLPTENNRIVVAAKRPLSSTQPMMHGAPYQGSGAPYQGSMMNNGPPAYKKQAFDRLGPRRYINTENTTLEIRKVPHNMNNISKMNEHFSKFGTIVNLQVCYNTEPDAALVTFSSNSEAAAAYHSSEPVFNNRFIRIFWHRPGEQNQRQVVNSGPQQLQQLGQQQQDPSQQSGGYGGDQKRSIKDRLGSIPPPHKLQLNNRLKTVPVDSDSKKSVVVSPTGELSRTIYNTGTHAPMAARLGNANSQEAAKKQQRNDVLRKTLEIAKQKQALLQKQIQQQKLLIEKLEKNKNMSAEDRLLFMKTVKQLAESIETLKKELTQTTAPLPVNRPPVTSQQAADHLKSRQQAQKAILDTELDIISKQNEGADTSTLRRKVSELKKEAIALGLLGGPPMRGGRGRGLHFPTGVRGRGVGRGRYNSVLTVDRRPKQVLVKGYSVDDRDDVVAHFSLFGEVENAVHDDSMPCVILNFKTRKEAENAIREGHVFKGQPLALAWYKSAAKPTASLSEELLPGGEEGGEGDLGEDDVLEVGANEQEVEDADEDVLLSVDDEEDEEDESRSWRR